MCDFFFEDFKIYSGLWPLSVSPRCQCVYTMAGQTPALQQLTVRVQKNHIILRKNTIFNEHPVSLEPKLKMQMLILIIASNIVLSRKFKFANVSASPEAGPGQRAT